MTDQAAGLRAMLGERPEIHKTDDFKSLSARVITVTSGKGGVGKTNFSVNLAINLRRQGKRVAIMDADFGLANIEVLFGIIPKFSLADVVTGRKPMEEVVTEGPEGILFVSGGSGLRELANITETQMNYLISNFGYLDSIADIIIVDTGAGISKSVVNFIKAASESIIITTPEPTSVADAYALIKTIKEEGGDIPEFRIVVNRVDDFNEGNEIFGKLQRVCDKFLGLQVSYLGAIPYDGNLVKAVKKQTPVSIAFPHASFSRMSEAICNKLLNSSQPPEKEREPGQTGIRSFMKRLAGLWDR